MDKLWAPNPVITTGGYTRDSGLKIAEETGRIIGYGVLFTANVGLPSPPSPCMSTLLTVICAI